MYEELSKSPIHQKSFDLALRIVRLCNFLKSERQEYTLYKQILRSGTSIGANIRESKYAQSTADFVTKINIALKEAAETDYWLELLQRSDYITQSQSESLRSDLEEVIKMLVSILKTTRNNARSEQ